MISGPWLALHVALTIGAPEGPTPAPRLEWLASPRCPDATRGAEQLSRFLGGRTLEIPARVELVAEGDGHRASVTVGGATRTLHADDCETLARAAALVVAVSLEPLAASAVVRGAEPEPEAPADPGRERELPVAVGPEPDAAPRPEPTATDRSAASHRRPSRSADASRRPPAAGPSSRHWLTVAGGLARAVLPTLTGLVRLGYAYDRGALRVQAAASYAPPRRLGYPDEPEVGGRFQSAAVDARACLMPTLEHLAVPLCAGVEGGAVLGRGFGVPVARHPVGSWWGPLVSVTARGLVHPRVVITAGVDLVTTLRRPAFHVGARETLFRSPPVGLRGVVGMELRLR